MNSHSIPGKHELVATEGNRSEWRVEAIDEDGAVRVALFSGPDAEERASEYARWKNRPSLSVASRNSAGTH